MSEEINILKGRLIESNNIKIYVRVEGSINIKRKEDTINYEDKLFSFIEAGINTFENYINESNSEPLKFSNIVGNENEKPKNFSDIKPKLHDFVVT